MTLTLPRRLGLSGVVDSQIRRYREDARRRRRVPDREIYDLVRLVVRRPDSGEVFLRVGRDLHGEADAPRWQRFLPRRLARALALRRVRLRLRTLFGRLLTDASAPFRLEAVDDILIRCDPGGDACEIVTGLARTELERVGVEASRLVHADCRAFGADSCVWELTEEPADEGADTALDNGAG